MIKLNIALINKQANLCFFLFFRKEGVKTLAKKTVSTKKNKPNKQKKKESKSAVLSEKKNSMSSLKVLKNQLWMKVVKELAGRANLIPIHQEILKKLVGRTCVPQHKDRFGVSIIFEYL